MADDWLWLQSEGALIGRGRTGRLAQVAILSELRSSDVSLGRASCLFSTQLGEFTAQSFSVLLATLLRMQEPAQKLPRQSSVVVTLLKMGDESLLPLDCDLALGYVPLG